MIVSKGQPMKITYGLTFLLFIGYIFSMFSQQKLEEVFSIIVQDTKAITIIDLNFVQQQVVGKDVQFVDVRTEQEYNQGSIDNAINISFADKKKFVSAFQKLDKKKPVYIYCYSGWRSSRAAKLLASIGFMKIYDFKGGYKMWSN